MLLSTKAMSICVAATWLLILTIGSVMANEETTADGKAVGGLRLRLEFPAAESGKKLQSQCNLVLENVGDSDLNVLLGISLGNGKEYHPVAIRLFARSKGNKTRTLIYPWPRVAGRIDPFVLPLLAGSSYTLKCLDKYEDSETHKPIDLTAKEYQITAELHGEAVTNGDGLTKWLAFMPYWQGKVRSNEVQLPLAKKPQ